MSIKEFSECVCNGVRAGLPYELAEAKVTIVYEKDSRSQLQINCPWSNIKVDYSLTCDYQEYLSGKCTPEFVIANILNNRNLYHVLMDFYNMKVSDFRRARNQIVSRIISSRPQNAKYLKNRPVKKLEGTELSIVWEFHSNDLYYDENMLARMPVTYDMMNAWGISLDELDEIARKNTPLLRPAQIKYMDQMLREDGIIDEDSKCFPFVVITNRMRIDGAIAVTYPGTRERLKAMLKDDVYILPSSIHECLAVAKNDADPRVLYQIVCDINRTQVEEKDFLADDVLEYTSDGCLVSALRNQKDGKQIDENSIFI